MAKPVNSQGVQVAAGIRCERIEVLKITTESGDDPYQRLREQTRTMRKLINTLARKWVVWHEQQGNCDRFLEFERERDQAVAAVESSQVVADRRQTLEYKLSRARTAEKRGKLKKQFADWLNTQKQKARRQVKLGFHHLPPDCSKFLYAELRRLFPGVNVRTLALAINRWKGTLTRTVDGVNDWYAALSGMRSLPSSRGEQPIPFDTQNGKLSREPGERGDTWRLTVRTCRQENGASDVDTLLLKTRGNRKLGRIRSVLMKCEQGIFAFKGSSLFYDERKKKFFVLLAYQRPSHVVADVGDGAAMLRAGQDCPLVLEIDESIDLRVVSRGESIAAMRQHNHGIRRALKSQYRYPAAGERGHGHRRKHGWRKKLHKLSRDWNEFVKRHNHLWSITVVRCCVDRGISHLTFVQPEGGNNFVGRAGVAKDVESSWQWHQLKTLLAQKCQDAGISFSSVKETEVKTAEAVLV